MLWRLKNFGFMLLIWSVEQMAEKSLTSLSTFRVILQFPFDQANPNLQQLRRGQQRDQGTILARFCVLESSTGCDLVIFHNTLKLHNICLAYVSNEIFTFLKCYTYTIITFFISIWFNNFEEGFGGKIQKRFLTPSRAI